MPDGRLERAKHAANAYAEYFGHLTALAVDGNVGSNARMVLSDVAFCREFAVRLAVAEVTGTPV